MKTNTLLLAAALSGLLSVGQAYAFDAPEQPAHGPHEIKADTNHDGKISHDEFMAASQKRAEEHFKRMDTNGDGFVDEAERKAAFDNMRQRHQEWQARHGKEAAPPAAPQPK